MKPGKNDVLDTALDDDREYPDKKDDGYIKLQELYVDLKNAYRDTYENQTYRPQGLPEDAKIRAAVWRRQAKKERVNKDQQYKIQEGMKYI